jgi:hypothetical protein
LKVGQQKKKYGVSQIDGKYLGGDEGLVATLDLSGVDLGSIL